MKFVNLGWRWLALICICLNDKSVQIRVEWELMYWVSWIDSILYVQKKLIFEILCWSKHTSFVSQRALRTSASTLTMVSWSASLDICYCCIIVGCFSLLWWKRGIKTTFTAFGCCDRSMEKESQGVSKKMYLRLNKCNFQFNKLKWSYRLKWPSLCWGEGMNTGKWPAPFVTNCVGIAFALS